ncbi:MAG: HEAT repeat domain-containing protein, partial [Planctomycetota bacterium]
NNQELKLQAIDALKYINEDSTADVLLNLLKDKDRSVRLNAISSLGYLKNPRVMDKLIEILADQDKIIREKSIDALRQITQVMIEFTPDAPDDFRKLQIDKIKKWWGQNKNKYLK